MRRWTVLWVAVLLAGCAGEEKKRAAATATPEAVDPATSPAECQDLWNTYARNGIEDYLVEAAATQAFVDFFNGECIVMAPVKPGARRVYIWVARGGRAPWGLPSQDNLPAGRDLRFNVQVTADGQLE
jgi:hypothetical protein